MKWKTENRKISSLKEWSKNPRSLTEKGLNDLEKSIKKFGIAEPIVINTDGTICGGHGRKKILERLGITEVDCYVPLKKLSDKDFEELNIRLNANIAGVFDWDILANEFDQIELAEWGVTGFDFVKEAEVDLSQYDEGANSYLNNTIRQVVLFYDVETHKQVLERLIKIGSDFDIEEDNSNVVLKLIEFYESKNKGD